MKVAIILSITASVAISIFSFQNRAHAFESEEQMQEAQELGYAELEAEEAVSPYTKYNAKKEQEESRKALTITDSPGETAYSDPRNASIPAAVSAEVGTAEYQESPEEMAASTAEVHSSSGAPEIFVPPMTDEARRRDLYYQSKALEKPVYHQSRIDAQREQRAQEKRQAAKMKKKMSKKEISAWKKKNAKKMAAKKVDCRKIAKAKRATKHQVAMCKAGKKFKSASRSHKVRRVANNGDRSYR